MVFHVWMWELDYKESWAPKIDAFELWCWRRLLRVPWTAGRSNQSILKEISPEYSLEGLMLKLKRQYFDVLWWKSWLIWKDPDAGRDWGQEEKRTTEDEMVGWHHWLNGHESEWTPGVGDGQGGLACCSPWGHKEADMTERLNLALGNCLTGICLMCFSWLDTVWVLVRTITETQFYHIILYQGHILLAWLITVLSTLNTRLKWCLFDLPL